MSWWVGGRVVPSRFPGFYTVALISVAKPEDSASACEAAIRDPLIRRAAKWNREGGCDSGLIGWKPRNGRRENRSLSFLSTRGVRQDPNHWEDTSAQHVDWGRRRFIDTLRTIVWRVTVCLPLVRVSKDPARAKQDETRQEDPPGRSASSLHDGHGGSNPQRRWWPETKPTHPSVSTLETVGQGAERRGCTPIHNAFPVSWGRL